MSKKDQPKIIKHAYSIILCFILFSILGYALIPSLSLQPQPSPKSRNFVIRFYNYGKNARIIEHKVCTPIEGCINRLKGIKHIESVCYKHYGYINVEINQNIKAEDFRLELIAALRQIHKKLPEQVNIPTIHYQRGKKEFSDTPILIYTLDSHKDLQEIRNYAENEFQAFISKEKGVGKVSIYGGNETEMVFEIDQQKIQQLGIGKSEIQTQIRRCFQNSNLGFSTLSNSFGTSIYQIPISTGISTPKTINEWKKIPITKCNGKLIYLGDICHIQYKETAAKQYFRINGKANVYIQIFPEASTNHILLAEQIKEKLKEYKLPSSYNLILTSDNSIKLQKELDQIGIRSLIAVIILLLFVLIVNRSLKYILLVSLNLLINLGICNLFYYFLHIEMHIYSLAAVTVSIGLLLDNIIVMADHIKNFQNKNSFISILAATLTTIAALSIILFLPEEQRFELNDFALVLIINLSISVISSLFLVPALLEQIQFNKKQSKHKIKRIRILIYINIGYYAIISFMRKYRKSSITIAILIFGIPIFRIPMALSEKNSWGKYYNKTLGSEFYQDNVRPIFDPLLGGCSRLFYYFVFDNNKPILHNINREKELNISCQLPKGSTIEQLNEMLLQLESIICNEKTVKKFTTQIQSDHYGTIHVEFKKEYQKKTRFLDYVKAKCIDKASGLLGASWCITGWGTPYVDNSINPGLQQDISSHKILIKGYNLDILDKLCLQTINKLRNNPRVRNVKIKGSDDSHTEVWDTEYYLNISSKKLLFYKYHPYLLYSDLKKYDRSKNSFFRALINGKYTYLRIADSKAQSKDLWNIQHRALSLSNCIPLNNLGAIKKKKINQIIQKDNQSYIRIIKFSYTGNYNTGTKLCKKIIKSQNAIFPLGFKISLDSRFNYLIEQDEKPYGLILIVIALIFLILAVLFESLIQPFAIIAMIPLSFCGIFLSFYFFKLPFGLGGYASFLLLCGIVVNTSIYILNEYQVLSRNYKGKNISSLKLYIKAFNHKAIPIFLTIISTILGMLPFIIISQAIDFWYGLAAGTIGGLLFSIPITILFLPVFCKLGKKK
ncbi:MAG: efflux RND transporter permease subunit [Bacteroidales bacterium]